MFKKKKNSKENQSVAITPEQNLGEEQIGQEIKMEQQIQQTQQLPPRVEKPVEQVPQQIQQPFQETIIETQQTQQQQKYAFVHEGKFTNEGKYVFVVETNYPLAIGYCNLTQ